MNMNKLLNKGKKKDKENIKILNPLKNNFNKLKNVRRLNSKRKDTEIVLKNSLKKEKL